MADIKARGYINKLTIKEYAGGTYAKYDLAFTQKEGKKGEETTKKLYARCVDFREGEFPTEGDYVDLEGRVTLGTWQSEDKEKVRLNIDINVASVTPVNGDRKPAAKAKAPELPKDETPPPSDPFDKEIPF